jgi:hypothetical protein
MTMPNDPSDFAQHMHQVRDQRRAILEQAFLEANTAINTAVEHLIDCAEAVVEFAQDTAFDPDASLNLLHAVWLLVPPPQRLRFLMEMLTVPECTAIQTRLLPDEEPGPC